jgi:hypothetical protein
MLMQARQIDGDGSVGLGAVVCAVGYTGGTWWTTSACAASRLACVRCGACVSPGLPVRRITGVACPGDLTGQRARAAHCPRSGPCL